MPGEDLADIEAIRSEWVRTKARQEANTGEKVQLRIRVGTFNVNGKMPSQDLASWVGGRSTPLDLDKSVDESGRFIPLLKRLSSLSLGGIDYNDTEADQTDNSDAVDRQESPSPTTSTLVPVDENPDLLVLGFQEVDLSTEALLYSTGTTREDAWCMAALAGLGEKSVLYEKVDPLLPLYVGSVY
jgi:phosphatidylinositol-bisphosphatase